MIRRLAVAVFLLGVVSPSSVSHAQGKRDVDRYDATFRKYSKRYFGVGYDWRVFKAQAMAESEMNPAARSWVGARGLMQLMPSTYKEIQSRSSALGSIDDPEWNIAAGIMHDRGLWRRWERDSIDVDRKDPDRPYAIPADNPFTGVFDKWYAYGVRNSFGMAFDPVTGALWDTENGPATNDEINKVAKGFNSGWNEIMGPDLLSPGLQSNLVQFPGSAYSDPEFASFNDAVAPLLAEASERVELNLLHLYTK